MNLTGFNSLRSWGVAVACSIVTLLLAAPSRLAGLFYVAFIEQYNVDREHASYPILICFALRCILGPFVAYLGEIFGYRAITCWGCLVGSVGLGACFFAKDMTFIYLSLGLFYGLGFAMSITLLPAILKQHFDKHLTNANGLALTGFCLSAFVMCPIYEYFAKEYGDPGALLLISGVMLHALPVAMFLKNPNYSTTPTDAAQLPIEESKNKEDISSDDEPHLKCTDAIGMPMQNVEIGTPGFHEVQLHSEFNASQLECEIISQPNLHTKLEFESNDLNPTTLLLSERHMKNITCTPVRQDSDEDMKKWNAHPQDTLCSSSSSACSNTRKFRQSTEGCCKITMTKSDTSCDVNKHKAVWKSLSVFIDPSFIILLINHALHAILVVIVWTIMIDMSRDKGISHDREIYLLMFLPVSEFFGYMSLGWVTDGGYLTHANFYGICFVCESLICGFLVWSYNFTTMMIGISLFGVVQTALASLNAPVVYKYIDEKKQSMAFASRHTVYAPLSFVIGPMIRYFRGNLGSYDWMMYIMSIACLFAGIIAVFLPYTSHLQQQKQRKL